MSPHGGDIFLGGLERISIVYRGFLGRRNHFSWFQDDLTTVGPTRGHPKWGHGPKMCFLYFLFNSVDRKCMGIFCGGESICEGFRTIWPLLDSLGAFQSRAVGPQFDFLYFLRASVNRKFIEGFVWRGIFFWRIQGAWNNVGPTRGYPLNGNGR